MWYKRVYLSGFTLSVEVLGWRRKSEQRANYYRLSVSFRIVSKAGEADLRTGIGHLQEFMWLELPVLVKEKLSFLTATAAMTMDTVASTTMTVSHVR